ncbi:hypothetical protein ACGFXC_11645 [Streptomyces sp. NPDC048507]|uniref:hypothetical protein n=1 Tax=Streptomyces sp. NPDC048507 TaxID=3365560 RepID=UPI00371C2A54
MSGRVRCPVVLITVAVAAALVGCAGGRPAAALEPPATTCFGAFSPAEIAPFMGTGKDVQVRGPAVLRLSRQRERENCTIDVDGKNRFFARAYRQPVGGVHSWPSLLADKHPEPLAGADDGKLWDDGAAVVLSCEGPTDSFVLELWVGGVVDGIQKEDRRPTLAALMKRYAEFAKQQTRCGA